MEATATPSSRAIEADAGRINAAHDEVTSGEIAIGVVIGRTSEFFDFFVYAIASVLVFPSVVFPYVDRLTGTLYSFALFALAFVARPFGSFLFLAIDRAYGRGTKLTIALFLLGGATVSIGFLPGYTTVGVWAAILLGLFRVAQGVALGGAWDGLSSLLALNVPENRRGWYAMIPQLGAPLGLMVAAGLFAYFTATLSAVDFLDWAGATRSSSPSRSMSWRCSRGCGSSAPRRIRTCSKARRCNRHPCCKPCAGRGAQS